MKIRMFSKLLAVLSLIIPSAAYSAIAFENYQSLVVPQPRWYPNYGFFTSYFLGVNNVTNFTLSPNQLSEISLKLANGYYGGIALGFRNKHFRFDEELSLRYNGANGFESIGDYPSPDPVPPSNCGDIITHGPVIVTSLMTNIYWDFLMGNYIMPFIGIGAGGAFLINSISNTITGADLSQNDIGYAFQAMAGIGIPLSFHSEIDVFFKFYQAYFINYTNTVSNCDSIPAGPGVDVDFKPKYTASSIAIEWRISPNTY